MEKVWYPNFKTIWINTAKNGLWGGVHTSYTPGKGIPQKVGNWILTKSFEGSPRWVLKKIPTSFNYILLAFYSDLTNEDHHRTKSMLFRCPITVWYSSHDLDNGPFNDQTVFNHLNTRLVRYSDLHCINSFKRRLKWSIRL